MSNPGALLPPVDEAVPALRILLGAEARDVVSTALDPVGLRVREMSTSQVRYVPGRAVTAQYRVEAVSTQGRPDQVTVVAASGVDVPADVPILGADGVEIAFWAFPNDPFLTGLALAADPEKVRRLLERLGAEPQDFRLETRAYRATRRAVVEAIGDSQRLFLKVVRPSRAQRIHERHVALAQHVPVPQSLGWSATQGIVALQAMPGVTLRTMLARRSNDVPTAANVIELLDRLPIPTASGDRKVAGPHESVSHHVRLISAVVPGLADRLDELVSTFEAVLPEPPAAVHGDFHASQILVDGAAIVGLVDVDTAGIGERANDLASLLGQLSTLTLASRAKREYERYGGALIDRFDRQVDPVGLRLRTAAVIVGLATGPFRVQEPRWRERTEARVALAERWVASARELAGRL